MSILNNLKSKKRQSSTDNFYHCNAKKNHSTLIANKEMPFLPQPVFKQNRQVCLQSKSLTNGRSSISHISQSFEKIEPSVSVAKPTDRNNRISENEGIFNIIWALNTTHKKYLQKIMNLCMKDGKKNKSFKIISNTLRRLCLSQSGTYSKKQTKDLQTGALAPALIDEGQRLTTPFALILLINAIENVRPILEVKKVRISGATQLVPSIIPKSRQISLGFRWIMEAAISRRNAKKNLTLEQCFFAELIDASKNIGAVRKRRDDLHKIAESNRGFAHYRWWDR
jgi:ribosomal protein S7